MSTLVLKNLFELGECLDKIGAHDPTNLGKAIWAIRVGRVMVVDVEEA